MKVSVRDLLLKKIEDSF